MPWVNVPLPIKTGICEDNSIWNLSSQHDYGQTTPFNVQLNAVIPISDLWVNNKFIFGDDVTFGIKNTYGSTNSYWNLYPHAQGGTSGHTIASYNSSLNYSDVTVCCGYETTQDIGRLLVLYSFVRNGTTIYHLIHIVANEFARYAYNNPPVSYIWQSVPSISGKNGILQSLVQIKEEALNDGEPVSEATVLSFDSLGNINIPSVIDEQMPVDPDNTTSATATYLIPYLEYGSYSALKLLVKKGSIPTSEEDADKVVDIDEPTNILRIGSKSVANLDEDSHYYFVVKVVDEIGTEASSEPKDIVTGEIPILPTNEVITVIVKPYSDGYQEKITATK